jgi:FkbH-like protein
MESVNIRNVTATEERLPGVYDWLDRSELLSRLCGRPTRLDLLQCRPSWFCAPLRIRVHRNQPFEFVASVLDPFLAVSGYRGEIVYGDYDDSLVMPAADPVDVELIWIDFDRYRDRLTRPDLVEFLRARIADLRQRSAAPILLSEHPRQDAEATALNQQLHALASSLADVRIIPLAEIGRELGDRVFDQRAAKLTGMALSDAACLLAAQTLGLVSLPSTLTPRLKAVVVDLDNTLYGGVVAEDGPEGLDLSPDHVELQHSLLGLRAGGVFLGIASRNEVEDVEQLFAQRTDLPLRLEHFSARSIAFKDKAAGIRVIAEALRIGVDTMLFIDDNPGEIATVAAELPGIHVLHAANPAQVCRVLAKYPGLHGYPVGKEDSRRVTDLAAAEARVRAEHEAASPEDYLRSLDITLTFAVNNRAHLARMAELSRKTNQFNTALARFSEVQIERRLDDADCRSVSVSLRDRLSDSGLIAAIFLRRAGTVATIDEMVISCRALGRNLEFAIVTEAIRRAWVDAPPEFVRFVFKPGPRNEPARRFLCEYTGLEVGEDGAELRWDAARAVERLAACPVTCVGEDPA